MHELRLEDPNDNTVVSRVARQLGVGTESLRLWLKQAEVDAGLKPGVTTVEHDELVALRKENKELRRANDILQAAATFFGNSTADTRNSRLHRRSPRPQVRWAQMGGRVDLRATRSRPLHLLRRQGPPAVCSSAT